MKSSTEQYNQFLDNLRDTGVTNMFDCRNGRKMKKIETESTHDFRKRIAALMRFQETGKRWSLVGASRAPACVVRKKRVDTKPTSLER